MAYNKLPTRSGHNMFTMASLLQKAARRGDVERTGYAAFEMYGSYQSVLWNRMMTISAEDCWGVLTKELVYLRAMDFAVNQGKNGYEKKPEYVSKAVTLLCKALKSRDACYFACNFVITPNDHKMPTTANEVDDCYYAISNIDDEIFNIRNICRGEIDNADELQKIYAEPKRRPSRNAITNTEEVAFFGAELQKAIRTLDMYSIGHAMDILRGHNRNDLWKIIIAASVLYTNGDLTDEIIALKLTDAAVNRSKTPDKRDEIYLSKAVMLLCYRISGRFDSILSYERLKYHELVDWSKYKVKDISKCILPNNEVPEWVYDVHTIKGKQAGKTDWGMNLVEHAALSPLQKSFFDDGSWEIRYDYKVQHGLCTAAEYASCNEYRKTHEANPVKELDKPVEKSDEGSLDEFSKEIRTDIEGGLR